MSGTRTYDASGNLLGVEDADALSGVSGHTDATHCTINGTAYTTCATFDSLYDALPTTIYSVLNSTQDQATTLNYTTDGSNTNSPDATNGWGTWLTTSTDANSAVTAYGYDALGRLTALAKPGDTLASPTTSYQYVDTCAATGAQEPCVGLATTQKLSSGVTTESVTYYDGWGRPVETLSEANRVPDHLGGSYYTLSVRYTLYDAQGRVAFQSDPYFVTQDYAPGPSPYLPSYARPDGTQAGSSESYDGLDRVTKAQDPIGNTTTTTYSVQAPQGANVADTAPYEATTVVDANGHQHVTLADGFGRTRYSETFTGNSPNSYALYGTSASAYDWLGNVTSVTGPNPPPGAAGLSTTPQTTTSYDLLGRATGMSDADLGNNWTYQYDANGNLLESVASNGANGTVWHGYDGLNREVWRNTVNSATTPTPYVQEQYDTATNGKGRLATESFNQGASLGAGSYSYTYDARGQVMAESVTLDGTNFPLSFGYNDAGQPQTVTYSDGESFGLAYNPFGWLNGAQTTPYQATSAVPLAPSITYNSVGGAAMRPTGGTLAGGTYSFSASYDNDLRLTGGSVTLASSNTTLYSTSRGYDGVGNVTGAQTTLAAGSDSQAFCYDEQNRLTWATSQTATGPCGAQNTAGSLTVQGAQYTASYAYDALNRLTSSPLGSGGTHLHAATSVSNGYTAQYGTAGSMYCRAPDSTTTCTGSTYTGARMGYDHEGRLIAWQNTWTNPTATAAYAYDGAGQRVAQSVTSGGTTSTTWYVGGGLEELTVSGTSSTLTKYEAIPGVCNVVVVGTGPSEAISYVTTDGLGSVSEALDSSGHVTAQQLYGPYGGGRYSSGTMPTAKGFTGQYADAASSGLDYYGARYYDPLLGQFTSADTDAKGGLNRYGYVADDPETATDPTGHRVCNTDGSDCRPTPPHGSTTKDLGYQNLCGSGHFTDVCNLSDGNFGWFDLWGDVIETIEANGTILWSYRDGGRGADQCDSSCVTRREQAKAKHDAAADAVGFSSARNLLIGLTVVIGAIAAIALFTGNPEFAAFLGRIVAALADVVAYLSIMAEAFQNLANQSADWFSQANVNNALDGVTGIGGPVFTGSSAAVDGVGSWKLLTAPSADWGTTLIESSGLTVGDLVGWTASAGLATVLDAGIWEIAAVEQTQLTTDDLADVQ